MGILLKTVKTDPTDLQLHCTVLTKCSTNSSRDYVNKYMQLLQLLQFGAKPFYDKLR